MASPAKQIRYTDWLWRNWLWIGWTLPAIRAITEFVTLKEVPELAFLVALIILLVGALGLVPRAILRARGFGSLPAKMAPVLIASWWCWVFLIFIHVTTSARIYNAIPVLELLGDPISENLAEAIVAWTALICVAILVVLVILAIAHRSDKTNRHVGWRRVFIAVAFGFPLVLVALAVCLQIGVMLMRDAAGETVFEAHERSSKERVELVRERYKGAQQDVVEVRELIAPWNGWSNAEVYIDSPSIFKDDGAESYAFDLEYVLAGWASPEDVRKAVQYLEEHGWDLGNYGNGEEANEFVAVHKDGRVMRLLNDSGESGSELSYISQEWWTGGDEGSIGEACPAATLSDFFSGESRQPFDERYGQIIYSGDEWPEC